MILKPKMQNQIFNEVFQTESGKAVLLELAQICGAYQTSHTQGDPTQTAFNEGKRFVFLTLMKVLNMNHELMNKQYQQSVDQQRILAQFGEE